MKKAAFGASYGINKNPSFHYNVLMPGEILHTKFFKPPLKPALVPRPHLVKQLNEGIQSGHKLLLLSAPAGYGKTTLLLHWLEDIHIPVAWLSLDRRDNDPRRFLIYVVAAINHVLSDFGSDTIQLLLAVGQEVSLEKASILFLNQLAEIDSDIVLVLDDYHDIQEAAVHEIVTLWLDHLPANVHLVLTSRSDPPLPLSRLRAKGQLTQLKLQALRFSNEESDAYLRDSLGLELSKADVAILMARTDGWPAGLQLAAISLRSSADRTAFVANFSGSDRLIVDYLIDEVLGQQPAEFRDFLLQTSILDHFNAALCDALLETGDSQRILEELEARGLFILPLDSERRYYRYHPLFADLLLDRLQRALPGRASLLHRRASQWYAMHEQPAEAIRHAFAVEDLAMAEQMLAENALELVRQGEVVSLLDWLGRLSSGRIQLNPRLAISLALARLLSGDFDSLDDVLSPLQIAEEALLVPGVEDARRLLAEVHSIRSAVLVERGEIDAGLALAEPAFRHMTTDPARYGTVSLASLAVTLGLAYHDLGLTGQAAQKYADAQVFSENGDQIMLRLLASYELGKIRIEQALLPLAERIFRGALTWIRDRFGASSVAIPLTGASFIGLGCLFYEWNRLEEAVEYLTTGVDRAQEHGGLGIDRDGLLALSLAYQARNKPGLAQEMISKALAHARRSPRPDAFLQANTVRVRLWLAQGNVAAAERWAANIDLDGLEGHTAEIAGIALARVYLNLGQARQALDILDLYEQAANSNGRLGILLQILALQALGHHQLGSDELALASLEQSLGLAEAPVYIRLYLDLGSSMARLLYLARQNGITPTYCDRLLAAFSTGKATVKVQDGQPLIEPLSERELEVLQLLAQGLTNKEIASRLYLSPNTIKRHANNIYEKLAVHGRTEAAAKARDLGILN